MKRSLCHRFATAKGSLLASALAFGLSSFGACAAADVAGQPGSEPDKWQYELTPYIWGAGVKGDVKIGPTPSQSVNASFSDIWDHLDAGAMLGFEGRRNRFGFAFDGLYLKATDSTATPGPVFGNAEGEFTQQMYGLAGTYRVVQGTAPVDLLVGARYLGVDATLKLTSGLAPEVSQSQNKSWWDGFGGVRVSIPFDARWAIVGYADAGAGGSKLSWQAVGGVNYQFSHVVSGKLGYRYFSVNYDKDNFRYDMSMAGPYAAIGFRF